MPLATRQLKVQTAPPSEGREIHESDGATGARHASFAPSLFGTER